MSRSARLLTAVLTMSLLASGCSVLSGQSPEPAPAGPLEKSRITVAILPTVEIAPLELAIRQKYFAAEGLDVTVTIAGSGQQTVEGMVNGQYDIVFSTYPPLILAQAKHITDVKLVAANSAAAPGTAMLVTGKASTLRTAADLVGRKVAVTAKGTMSELMVRSAVATDHAEPDAVTFVEMPFPDMPTALDRGTIDAAMIVEPFVTAAERSVGAKRMLDLATGPLTGLPFTAFGATNAFVTANPKTVTAFQRGLTRAAEESADRTKIEPLLTSVAKIDREVAAAMKLPVFRTDLDAAGIQRIARLMTGSGQLKTEFDVKPLLP